MQSGHFNQRDTPEAREAMFEEMQDKENERAKRAKKEMKAYQDGRKKWAKRLANLKILCGIVVLGLCEYRAGRRMIETDSSPSQGRCHLPCRAHLLYLRYRVV